MDGATHYAHLASGKVWLDLSMKDKYRINYGAGWEIHKGWPPIRTDKVKPVTPPQEQ